MTDIVDISFACGGHANRLVLAGVRTVIRYYSRDTGVANRRLTKPEATQFAAAGLRIAVVHEARHGDQMGSFTEALGILDATYACDYAVQEINQPAGSAIYFGADVETQPGDVEKSMIPYFQGVAQGMAAAERKFRVGVYGSGLTCPALLDAGLADLAWLSQSTGFPGYRDFLASNRWALRQLPTDIVAGLECDPDMANPAIGDYGAFNPGP
jgi:hypothetical protein